jgi:AcrR family transcriptional regulator
MIPRKAAQVEITRRPQGPGKYDRARSPKERWEEQEAALLEAAMKVFARRGYAGATVEGVIAEAGMSRRTFYEHFKDMRDALDQVYERASALAYQMVEMVVRAEGDPLLRIRAGIDAWLGAVSMNPDAARVVFREARSAGPEYEARRELQTTRYSALLFEALAEAHACGQIPRVPDELTVYALTSALEAVAMRYLAQGRPLDIPAAGPRLHALVLSAFGASGSSIET